MPVPAGGDPDLVGLFTLEELDAWAQTAVGAEKYAALEDLTPLKLVALHAARRMVRNADGRRSSETRLDDYATTVTYATETLAAPYLTDDDVERIWAALGVRRSGAFTIR